MAPPISTPPPIIQTAAPVAAGMSSDRKIAIGLAGLGAVGVLIFACLIFFLVGSKQKLVPTRTITNLVNSNAVEGLLNDDQRLVMQFVDRKFHKYFDARTFEGWSNDERASLERRSLDTIQGPRSDEYYQAINSLAALHSTNALPLLRKLAFDHTGGINRIEINNRPRWMAIRGMGMIDDKTVVPEMTHLLYHNSAYVRWSAQISLVKLTGQNFGNDWKAWGDWWNSQNGQPPFNREVVHWWHGQVEPDELAKALVEDDRKFFNALKTRSPTNQALEAEEK